MSYGNPRPGGTRAPVRGSDPRREDGKLTDTSGTAPVGGPSGLQQTANPKTIVIDCNRRTARITQDGGNPANNKWTCQFPAVQLKAGDEIRVNSAFISSIGVGDLIAWNRAEGGLDQDNRAAWVCEYYQTNDGKNGKREGYNMVNHNDEGTSGIGGGEARVWGGDGIWAFPVDNQAAPLYQNMTLMAYMIPPSSAAGAKHNLLNPWCPPGWLPWENQNGGTAPSAPPFYGASEAAVRWYEDPNMAGRFLSNKVRFRSLMSYDFAGGPATAPVPPAIASSGNMPWCFRILPHMFDATDMNYNANPVWIMEFGHAAGGTISTTIYPGAVPALSENKWIVPNGYSFYLEPAQHPELDLVPAGPFNENTPSRAKAEAVAKTMAYKYTCVGHYTDPVTGNTFTMVERPYASKEFDLTLGAPATTDVSAWGTAYVYIGEGGMAGADSTGDGVAENLNARYAQVNPLEAYIYNPDVLSTMYFGPSTEQRTQAGTVQAQIENGLDTTQINRCQANPTNIPQPSTYITDEVTCQMVDLDDRIGQRVWPVVPVSLNTGGPAGATEIELSLYVPTFYGDATINAARPIMTEDELISINGGSRNLTFIIQHPDPDPLVETVCVYLMNADVTANHNSGSNTTVPATNLVNATRIDPAPAAPLPAGQKYTTWRFTNVNRDVQRASAQTNPFQQNARSTIIENDGTIVKSSVWLASGFDKYYDVMLPQYAPITIPSTRPNFYYQNGSQYSGNTRVFAIEIGNHQSNPNGRTVVSSQTTPPANINFAGWTGGPGLSIQFPSRTAAGAALQPMGLPIFNGTGPSAPYSPVSFNQVIPLQYTVPIRHYRRQTFQINDDYSSPSDVATALTTQTHELENAQGEWGNRILNSAGKGAPQNNLVFPVYSSFAQSSEPLVNGTAGTRPAGWNPSERGDGTISTAGGENHGSYKALLNAYNLPANRFDPAGTRYATNRDYWLYFRTKYLSINKPRLPQGTTTDAKPPANISYATAYVRKGNYRGVNNAAGLSFNQDFNICGQSNFSQIAGDPISGPVPFGYSQTGGGPGNAVLNPGGIARSACFGEADVGLANPNAGQVLSNNDAVGYPINFIDLTDDNCYISQFIGASDVTFGWDDASSRFTIGYVGEPSVATFDVETASGGAKAITIYNPSPSGKDNYQFLYSQTRVGGVNVANWYSSNPAFGQTPANIRTLYNVPATDTLDAVSQLAMTPTPNEWFLTDVDPVGKRFWTKLGFDEATQLSPTAPDSTRVSGFRRDPLSLQYIPLGTTELQLDSADSLVTSDEPPVSTPYYTILSAANNPSGTTTPQLARWEYASRGALTMRNANYGYSFGSTAGLPLSFKTNKDPTAIGGTDAYDMASSSYNPDRTEFTAYTVEADTSLIRAANLPIKQEDAYLYCLSNIVDGDFYTSNGDGGKHPIVGVLSKLNSAGDFVYSYTSPTSSFVRQDKLLTEVSVEIVTPDFRVPPGIDENSSVVFSITRQNDQPVEPALPVWYQQEQMWNRMLQQFDLMSQQIGGGTKQSSAERAQEIIREIADAVVDPDGDAALPERIVANYERLGLGQMGGRDMRQFLLQNPDAGDFLRDLATHANARIPDGTLAAVTDPESVTPETLLNTALQRPIDPPPAFAQTPEQVTAFALQQHIADMMEANNEVPIGQDVDPNQAQAALVAAQQAVDDAGPAPDVLAAQRTGEFDPGLGMGRERNLRVVDEQGNPVGYEEQQRARQRMIDDGFPVGGTRREQMAWHRAAPQRAAARAAQAAAAAERTDAPADDDAYESE